MKKNWKLYALHILDCTTKIQQIQERGNIMKDVILYDATLRNLQTMSEATRHLPDSKIEKYPQIPWKKISGFRNLLVHDYFGHIDSQTIIDIIRIHITPLKNAVTDMIKDDKQS